MKKNKLEMTDEESFVCEMAIRLLLQDLLNRQESVIHDVQAVAHNMAIDCFGAKSFRPSNPEDWIQYIQPLKVILDKLNTNNNTNPKGEKNEK